MKRRIKNTISGVIPLCLGLAVAKTAFALPFGIFEPRSLAMGGAGVASASSVNAVFYNPAILSTYKVRKEKGKNEAFSFPVLSIRAARAVETLADRRDVNYQADITNAFDAYNTDPTPANGQAALNTIDSLHGTLGEAANNALFLDASASLVIGIPSKYQGGAFFITQRGVGDGQLTVPAADLNTLNYYQQALQLIVAGDTAAAQANYPDAFEGGNLKDPSGTITSEANARAAVISELGIGISRQITILGTDFSVGLAPKMVQVTAYDYHKTISSSTQDKKGTRDDNWRLNVDLGVLKRIGNRWRVGLVVKNLIERSYATSTGRDVTIKPQWRMGAAYSTPLITYTMDLDLQANDGVYPGNAAQYVLAGVEIMQGRLRYRLGYRDSIAYSGPKEDGVFSAGLGLNFKPTYLDLAYAENHEQRALSMMFGFNF